MNKLSGRTVEQRAAEIQQCISRPLQDKLGFKPEVVLIDDGRNKIRRRRKTASAESWSPEKGDQILIRFTYPQDSSTIQHETQPSSSPGDPESGGETTEAVREVIEALNRAEHRRGFDFVALKWFRDTALPAEPFSWSKSDSSRREILADAIQRRLILTNKVPNPRSPFPVTTIRLNRLSPEVAAVLGEKAEADSDFHPVEIRGEPLSSTIIRERRQ